MAYEHTMCILLAILLLSLCYFSPTGKEEFENSAMGLKSDGSPIGTYNHSIVRPLNNVSLPHSDIKDINSNRQVWCSKENAVSYYAMRPLVSYNSLLQALFEYLTKDEKVVSTDVGVKILNRDIVDEIMGCLMTTIAEAVTKIPKLQNNGSWKNEEFHYTDASIYKSDEIYEIIFNLYNPLRSTSTLTYVIISSKNYSIQKIGLVNKEFENPGVSGYNLSNGINVMSNPVNKSPEFIYGNTLIDNKFNSHGFYNSDENVEIEGGVPEVFTQALLNYEN